jgi:hypothetical protein
LRWTDGIAHSGAETAGGKAVRGVIYGAILRAACWAALLLML